MTRSIPLPSPNGTNRAGLFMAPFKSQSHLSGGAAYDSMISAAALMRRQLMRGRAYDESLVSPEKVKAILDHCRDCGLSEDILDQLATLLSGGALKADSKTLAGDRSLRQRVADAQIRTGADFAARFPGAARISDG
jgi:hypothetical protein